MLLLLVLVRFCFRGPSGNADLLFSTMQHFQNDWLAGHEAHI